LKVETNPRGDCLPEDLLPLKRIGTLEDGIAPRTLAPGTRLILLPPRRCLADRMDQRDQLFSQLLKQDSKLGAAGPWLVLIKQGIVKRPWGSRGIQALRPEIRTLAQARRFLPFELDDFLQPGLEVGKAGIPARRDPLMLGQRGGSGQRFNQVARKL